MATWPALNGLRSISCRRIAARRRCRVAATSEGERLDRLRTGNVTTKTARKSCCPAPRSHGVSVLQLGCVDLGRANFDAEQPRIALGLRAERDAQSHFRLALSRVVEWADAASNRRCPPPSGGSARRHPEPRLFRG